MKKLNFVLIIIFVAFIASCSVYNSLMNISKLKFKLGEVNNFKINNISINEKSKLSDFNALDIVKLTSTVVSGDFPVSFTVDVLAQNPNKSSSPSEIENITLE